MAAASSPPTSSVSVLDALMTDEVMKRRLLIDGDGGGDDRKILGVTKAFLSFCSEVTADDNDLSIAHKKILREISHLSHANVKSQFSIRAYEEAKEMYINRDSEVLAEIEKAKEQIDLSKKLLEEAKEHRKHRTEYNALARLIRGQPDRKETEAKRLVLQNELADLQSKQDSLDARLENRKRSMHVLMSAIGRIDDMINEEALEMKAIEDQASKRAAQAAAVASSATHSHAITPHPTSAHPAAPIPMEVEEPQPLPHPPAALISGEPPGFQTPIQASKQPQPTGGSNPGSPLEEITPDGHSIGKDEHRPVIGTISSVPCSPVDGSKSEKYEDLSESE